MDPALLLALAERLPDTSMTTALMRGGRDHFGWGQDRYMLADIYDALNLNTTATGQWKKKPPEIKPYPRPKVKASSDRRPKKVSIKELHAQFAGAMKRQNG